MFPKFSIRAAGPATRKSFLVGILAVGCFAATSLLVPTAGSAQVDPRVAKSMETLKALTAKLGAPKVEGKEPVGGKDAPALHFGATKINNNFEIVDAIGKQDGKGMTASLFVKSGDEFIRASTSIKKDDGSRAIGTTLDMDAAAGMAIAEGKAYYGPVAIFGKPYITGYEPMKDGSGNIIGVYYVGYPQSQ